MIRALADIKLDMKILQKTKIGFTLDKIRKSTSDETIKKSAKSLLKQWQSLDESKQTEKKKEKKETKSKSLDFELTAPLPTKNKKGQLVFEDAPDFRPNLTPKEVLHRGSFGGTYFRPIYSSVTKQKYKSEMWQELPEDWLE